MCSSSAPPPDPLIGQAAAANAQIAQEALDWYKAKDEADKPARDAATKAALDQSAVQTATAQKQNAMADDTYAYTQSTFRPLEQKMASDAQGYDTPQRREQAASQAMGDVGTQIDQQRDVANRDLASRGVDPSSGSAAASLARMGIGGAAAQAAAGNQARNNVEAVGAAKVADAAALGRGIAATNATQTQLGLQAGNSSVNNAQVPLAISAQQGAQYAQGAGIGIQGNQSAGGLMVQKYGADQQAASANNGTAAAIGSIAGAALMAFSDENMKDDVTPTTDKEALSAVKKTPVKNWKYKAGSPGDDGGAQHTGPMAQDVKKTMGSKVAPNGKMIDLISANGITMKAVQAVNKKVDKLAAKMGVPVST